MRGLVAAGRLALLLGLVAALLPLVLAARVPAHLAGARGARASLLLASRLQGLWGRLTLRWMGIRLCDRPTPSPGVGIVVANHVSYADVPLLASIFPGRFVAAREIADWPLLGWMVRSAGTILVDRGSARDVVRVGREMEATTAAGVPVLLFPESGSSGGWEVQRFKTPLLAGAARRGTRCLAVSIGYEADGDPFGAGCTVCWWGGMGLWRHLWRLLRLRGVRARVRIAPQPLSDSDRKELGRRLQAEVEAIFEPMAHDPRPPDYPWLSLLEP